LCPPFSFFFLPSFLFLRVQGKRRRRQRRHLGRAPNEGPRPLQARRPCRELIFCASFFFCFSAFSLPKPSNHRVSFRVRPRASGIGGPSKAPGAVLLSALPCLPARLLAETSACGLRAVLLLQRAHQAGDYVGLEFSGYSMVTAVRMRFPGGRKFVFNLRYSLGRDFDWEDASEVRYE